MNGKKTEILISYRATTYLNREAQAFESKVRRYAVARAHMRVAAGEPVNVTVDDVIRGVGEFYGSSIRLKSFKRILKLLLSVVGGASVGIGGSSFINRPATVEEMATGGILLVVGCIMVCVSAYIESIL